MDVLPAWTVQWQKREAAPDKAAVCPLGEVLRSAVGSSRAGRCAFFDLCPRIARPMVRLKTNLSAESRSTQ